MGEDGVSEREGSEGDRGAQEDRAMACMSMLKRLHENIYLARLPLLEITADIDALRRFLRILCACFEV
jgi:hypothetical protein